MTAGLVYTDPDGVEHQQVPAGWRGWVGGRQIRWAWLLLDIADREVGHLDGVDSGRASLTYNVFADTQLTGSLYWTGPVDAQPPWERARVQPWVEIISSEGHGSVRWPLGVLITSTPDLDLSYGTARGQVELYDKTLLLREATSLSTLHVPKGVNVAGAVRSLVHEVTPSSRVSVEETTEVTRSDMVWDPGTTYLRIVNDILAAAGYFAIWVDGEGVFRATRYQAPQSRPVEWNFETGKDAIHSSQQNLVLDTFKVPNRVRVISRATEELPALVGEAYLPESHRLSWKNRGERWVDMVVEGEEATSQEAVTAQAERTLEANTNLASTLSLPHAPLPLSMNGRVLFSSVFNQMSLDAVVQEMKVSCDAKSLWTSRLREVSAE